MRFLSLQTNSDSRRRVSIAVSDKDADTCHLLGNLPHGTEFRRVELVEFARAVIEAFEGCSDCAGGDE